MPNLATPGTPTYPMARQPAPQKIVQQPAPWQSAPPSAGIAPAKVRGAMPDPAPKFVLPTPAALGVSADLNVPPPAAATTTADWNQIQSRMERLNVLRYQK